MHCQPMVGMAAANLKTLKGTHLVPTSRVHPCLRAAAHRHPPLTPRQRVAVMERREEEGGWVGPRVPGDWGTDT